MEGYTDDRLAGQGGIRLSQNQSAEEERREQKAPDWKELQQELEEETAVYKAPELSGDHMDTASKVFTGVTGFLTYIALIVLICACAWLIRRDMSTFYRDWWVLLAAYVMSGVILTIDAAMVNHGYKPDKSLYIFAWLFNFMYPFRRDGHMMKKSNVYSYLLAMAVVIGFVVSSCHGFYAYHIYKGIYLAGNEEDKQKITALLGQQEDGIVLGEQLYKTFRVTSVATGKTGYVNKIVLLGNSRYDIDANQSEQADAKWNIQNMLFEDEQDYTVDTQLVFIRGDDSKKYRLSTIKINGKPLSAAYTYNYWRKVILQWDENGNPQ
jgi:hypothetical protein